MRLITYDISAQSLGAYWRGKIKAPNITLALKLLRKRGATDFMIHSAYPVLCGVSRIGRAL